MLHTSRIEIEKDAIAHNLEFIRNLLGDDVTFSSVVKGNAYGHGIEVFCPITYELGTRHFSVFCAYEADRVQKVVGPDTTIMIMGMIDNQEIPWAIENDIEFYIFEPDRLDHAIREAKKIGKPALVHLELETGLNRTGFTRRELKKALDLLADNTEHVVLKGLATHLAGAESIANYKRIKDQIRVFRKASASVIQRDWAKPELHIACSAAALRYKTTKYDMSRIGILQYGFFPSQETLVQYLSRTRSHTYPLRRAISWKSNVMSLKTVKAGEFIGYGTSYFTNIETHIALVPVGYSHGFSRSLSNHGKVLIRGKRLNVIGLVNMNMMAVDVTELDYAERGDEVVLIGNQGDSEISVSSFSNFSDLVNYELLTRLPNDIPRNVV